MMSIRFILEILAAICFLLAAIELAPPRINPIALGLLLWLFSDMVTR